MTIEVVSGDDVVIAATLKKGGATFTIDPGATVTAMLVSLNHDTAYTAEIAQSSATSGADWSNSLVVVVMGASETAGITYQGNAYLEVQVHDSIKETFFGAVRVTTGQIA